MSLDPKELIASFGMIGIFLIVFAESGLLIGFFLPGDSLLFTAGLLASQGKFGLNFPILLIGCFIAAFVGDQVGYTIGKRVGPALFRKPDSKLFKQEYVHRTEAFFKKHGPKTILLARFIPVVRTFAPVIAGVGRMHRKTFVTYNVVGAFLWAVGVTSLGYVLGTTIPSIDRYLLPIIALIIFLSVLPPLIEFFKMRREAKRKGTTVTQASETLRAAEPNHESLEA
ncbi:MAG: DedA family protein [Acidimicrobiia bacterium]